ncbi:MAG: hypothetical protein L3J41_04800 [Melioribacteraceae bacterium]|nr:hypothetical protein [Melioribacteraceae bacterium]
MKQLKLLILTSILFFGTVHTVAQDTQYWAKQYGTYGELLGGLVVGGVSDLSSTYYNPGSMAFTKDSALILTTHSIQAYLISIDNAFGTESNLTSSSVKASPGIFAIRLPFKWLGDNQIVISYITRYDFNFGSQELNFTPYSSSKNSFIANEASVYENLSEFWPGISWSKILSENIGIGATLYLPYRSQSARNQVLLQAMDSTGTNSVVTLFEDYTYFNLRTLIKFGVSINLEPLMLGVTVTTPSLNIFGTGSMAMNLSATNTDISLLGELPTFASDFQENLSSQFRSSLAIAVGAAYYLENTSFYFTAEWFNNVSEFNIMSPNSFKAQSSGEVVNYNSAYSLKSVINFGVGIKHIVTPNFTYYGSITSDQTAFVPNTTNKFALSNWDIIHIRSGGMFNIDKLSITLGLGYGFAGNIYNGLRIFGQKSPSRKDIKYHQLDLVFGFTYKL